MARCRVREKAVTSSLCGFRDSYLVKQTKFSSAVLATTIFTAKASHTQNMIFDHTLPLKQPGTEQLRPMEAARVETGRAARSEESVIIFQGNTQLSLRHKKCPPASARMGCGSESDQAVCKPQAVKARLWFAHGLIRV